MRACNHCRLELAEHRFPKRSNECFSCVSGRQRFGALARSRPHLLCLRLDVQRFIRDYETGRLAFTRALRPFGIRIVWRGFDPVVTVVPRLGSAGIESRSDC